MRILKNTLIWGAAAIGVFHTYQVYVARYVVKSAPEKALSKLSGYSEALIAQNKKLLKNPSPENAKLITKNAKEILRSGAPLSDDALLHIAMVTEGNPSLKTEILKIAKGRNSRNRITLAAQTQQLLTNGELTPAFENIDLLMRLDQKNDAAYAQILNGFYSAKEGRDQINAALKGAPDWSYEFLRGQMQDADRDKLLALKAPLATFAKASTERGPVILLQDLMLRRLEQFGDLQNAYAAWNEITDFSGTDWPKPGQITFNPNFRESEALVPFNWFYANTKSASVNLEPNGGVFLSFKGDKEQTVLQQVVKVPVGTPLEFSFEAKANYFQRNGRYEWHIACPNAGKKLAVLPVDDSFREASSGKIDIPSQEAACEFLYLQLWAKPTIYRKRISMLLTRAELKISE